MYVYYRRIIYINDQRGQIVFMFSVRATPTPTNQNINVNTNSGKKAIMQMKHFDVNRN